VRPLLPADLAHMPMFNSDAPKGGRWVQALVGPSIVSTPLHREGMAIPQSRGFVALKAEARGGATTKASRLRASCPERETDEGPERYVTSDSIAGHGFRTAKPVTAEDVRSHGLAARQGRPNTGALFQSSKARSADPHGCFALLRGDADARPLTFGLSRYCPVMPSSSTS